MKETIVIARLILGLVFTLSAIAKLRDPRGFARGVERLGLVPGGLSAAASFALILTEAIIAFSLLSGIASRMGVLLALALLLLFFWVLIRNIQRKQPLPCYCFGAGDSEVTPRVALLRSTLLLVLVVLVVAGWIGGSWPFPTVFPKLEQFLLALAALMIGSWLLQVPSLREMHRTPIPEAANSGRLVSLRDEPLDTVST